MIRFSIPQRLLLASVAMYAFVFSALLLWGRPGLGLGGGFYIAVIFTALATGPVQGALAGVAALALYELALLGAGRMPWSTVLSAPTAIRLAGYVAAGLVVGYFATLGRRMLAESLHVLDDLFAIAKRDSATGAFTPHGLEAAINRRLALRGSFALLVGETEADLRSLGRLSEGDDLARLGKGRFAVLTLARDAERACAAYARELGGAPLGWAVHPEDGTDALSLYGAALERLHARRAS